MTAKTRSSHWSKELLLLAGSVLVLAVTTQCRSVTDSVVGAQATSANAGSCISACSHAANELMRQESERHVENVKACGKSKACKASESDRHEAAVKAIQEQRKSCQAGCHHQGGGRGGR